MRGITQCTVVSRDSLKYYKPGDCSRGGRDRCLSQSSIFQKPLSRRSGAFIAHHNANNRAGELHRLIVCGPLLRYPSGPCAPAKQV